MSRDRTAGRATGSLVLLLLILSGAGAWNYHRNWQIEKETEAQRPYASYASADLEALRSAYQSELGEVRAQFDSAKARRVRPRADMGSIRGNVEQFQRTAQTSHAIRNAAANVAEREGQISELDRELEIRARLGKGMFRHLKLLTTI